MKLSVSEKWMAITPADRKLRWLIPVIIIISIVIGIVIAVSILTWQQHLLIVSSGETLSYIYLDFLLVIIIILGSIIGVPLIVILLYNKCHNIEDMVDMALVLTVGALFTSYFVIQGIWFSILLPSATGDLYTIYALQIARLFLFAVLPLILTAIMAMYIYKYKKECDVVLKGDHIPTAYLTESGMSARIKCNELHGQRMCKVPRIDSIEY